MTSTWSGKFWWWIPSCQTGLPITDVLAMHKYSLRRKWFAIYSCWSSSCLGDLWGREEFLLLGTELMDLYNTSHIENSSFYWRNEAWRCCPHNRFDIQGAFGSANLWQNNGIGITSTDRKFRDQIPVAWVLASSSIDQSIHKMDGESMELHFPKRRQRARSVCFSANKEGPPLMRSLGQLIPPFPTSTWLSRPPFGVPFIRTLSRYSSLVLWNDTQVGNQCPG